MLIFLFILQAFAQIEGQWLTGDKTGEIEIYKNDKTFEAKIIGGKKRGDGLDGKNPDKSLRSREVMGMTILTGLIQDSDDKNFYSQGRIYDPDSGNTYKCKITQKNENEIELRGYIGISLFGRSETWTRKP
ncbi:MAG: DUF2147 domain-containing protein [Bacteriovoracaceae bacterium]|nr:DUF2147 domain-containing protein [Bacteriovoracaceae bacterium]